MELEQVSYIISRTCSVNKNLPIIAGISGGPDSLALFHLLKRLDYLVIPVHFDHLLRPGSTKDADILTEIVERMGCSLIRGTADVAGYAGKNGLSIEDAARILRYQFLFEQARSLKAQAVMTAHTADDQVETVLMHILRGSGLTGLKGMVYRQVPNAWDDRIPLVRPLLDVWRTGILEYCRESDLTPLIDETNAENQYLRNRIRNVLIPELEANYNPQVKNAILRLSRSTREESEIVREALESSWKDCLEEAGKGYLRFVQGTLRSQTIGMQSQIIRKALKILVQNEEEISYDTIQKAVDYLGKASRGKEIQLIEGVYCTLLKEDLLLSRAECTDWLAAYPQIGQTKTLDVGIPVSLGEKWTIHVDIAVDCSREAFQKNADNLNQAVIDANALSGPLIVRSALSGERFQPYGMNGQSIKVSDFFINEKLPRRVREAYPVVACGERIVWIPGYRLAHPFRITRETKSCLIIRLVNQ